MTVFEMAVRVPFIIRDPTHPGTHGLHTAGMDWGVTHSDECNNPMQLFVVLATVRKLRVTEIPVQRAKVVLFCINQNRIFRQI